MLVPDDLLYAETHEWIRVDAESGTIGITDHAQAELTDIVYVELPRVGSVIEAKKAAAVVESVKAASDIYSPVSGEVIAVNTDLESNPGLVNTDPYGNGWLFRIHLSDAQQLAALKDPTAYKSQIGV